MFINLDVSNRKVLTNPQAEFLVKAVPLARWLQNQTLVKADFKGIYSPKGFNASLILADLIHQSNWGEHPLAQKKYRNDGETKYANNLSLLEITPYWKGISLNYGGILYRGYRNWLDFAINYSDLLIFSGQYTDVLRTPDLKLQTKLLSLTKPNSQAYNDDIVKLIHHFNLREFDG